MQVRSAIHRGGIRLPAWLQRASVPVPSQSHEHLAPIGPGASYGGWPATSKEVTRSIDALTTQAIQTDLKHAGQVGRDRLPTAYV